MRSGLSKTLGALIAVILLPLACSASSGGNEGGSSGGGSGGGGNATSGGSGGGGNATSGGSGGSLVIDSGTAGAGTGGSIGDACATTSGKASDPQLLPADIIWAVDQSGSMDQETAYVQAKINDFANLIAQSGIDYHVVMIASTSGGNAICVPAPLSGGNCGNGPRFRLVDQKVDSNDALDQIITQYPKYQDFLRLNAVKHFVVVSDDNATDSPINSPLAFTNALAGLQPAGMFTAWNFHAIYAYGTIPIVGCIGAFGTGAAYGTVYEKLVQQSAGAQGVICNNDWTTVFQAISTAVVVGSKISCEYSIPAPDPGQTLDPNAVNVDYLPGGNPPPQAIPRVNDQSECAKGPNPGGWYFDDNLNPTKIILCSETCAAVQSDANAKIEVKFGCASVFKPPA